MRTQLETVRRFGCFGSDCAVVVAGDGAEHAAAEAEAALLTWHRRFTRFSPASELSQLNADPRGTVPVTPMMARFVQAAIDAAHETGGLVDATLIGALEDAGYRSDLRGSLPLSIALGLAPARRPAAPAQRSRLSDVRVDALANTVSRPPGVRLDSGGVAKGLFADVIAERLAGFDAFAVDCSGDLRIGGTVQRRDRRRQPVRRFGDPRLRALARRHRHQRHRPAQLARQRRPPRAPSARPVDRPPGLHRRGPGDRAGADGARGRAARQVRGAQRAGRRRRLPSLRRARRP